MPFGSTDRFSMDDCEERYVRGYRPEPSCATCRAELSEWSRGSLFVKVPSQLAITAEFVSAVAAYTARKEQEW